MNITNGKEAFTDTQNKACTKAINAILDAGRAGEASSLEIVNMAASVQQYIIYVALTYHTDMHGERIARELAAMTAEGLRDIADFVENMLMEDVIKGSGL